jgi:hypothetical protein
MFTLIRRSGQLLFDQNLSPNQTPDQLRPTRIWSIFASSWSRKLPRVRLDLERIAAVVIGAGQAGLSASQWVSASYSGSSGFGVGERAGLSVAC